MSNCDGNWRRAIFDAASKKRTNFRGENSSDMPSRFRGSGIVIGKEDFLAWANLPEISYSANPSTLYDLPKLERLLGSNPCFVEDTINAQKDKGITYPPTFYLGLGAAGVAILFTLFNKR